ncbi:MAG: FAD-binding protein [Bacteroidetes bacterium]|nr:FAD-binding protein [Bacteroidota bacterium]
MIKKLRVELLPEVAFQKELRAAFFKKHLAIENEPWWEKPIKQSIDARGKRVKVILETEIHVNESYLKDTTLHFKPKDLETSVPVYIIGAGPAGLFAALRAIELGMKPVIIERGKDVRERRRDLAAITKNHDVNPESNYCFGEGGAGTYSDGKLYTRSKKRGSVQRILHLLNEHGAPDQILYEAHPHIGTNKLPKVVQAIREAIIAAGGEIRFNTKLTNFELSGNRISALYLNGEKNEIKGDVILATGHSARDIYELLNAKKVKIEPKPFALGIRIEHPQTLIDHIQYHGDKSAFLPAAAYALVHQTHVKQVQRGVFSFCMCPGGFIVPAATSNGEVVVNGMSPSKRNSKYANSGIVVASEIEDFKAFEKHGALAGMHYQAQFEQKACAIAGNNQTAPAQRMVDFINGKVSDSLNDCSYVPGLASVDLQEVLGAEISARLRQAFTEFGQKMKGYLTNEANIVGVESRSSAPVRIPRDKQTLQHLEIENLYPCAEGAGYAGGIVSAAIDGMLCAEAVCAKA